MSNYHNPEAFYFRDFFCIFAQNIQYMKTKKLTDKEFVELIINKELEIAGADVRFKDLKSMTKEQEEEYKFFNRFSFNNLEEFLEWRQFFYDHFYEWQPKRVNKKEMEREFSWFNLQWGLKLNFPYNQIIEHDNKLKKNK